MQKKFYVKLNTIPNVKEFVDRTYRSNCQVDVSVGHYTVDGKSIMGIFSIDLTKELLVCAYSGSEEDVNLLYGQILALGVVTRDYGE